MTIDPIRMEAMRLARSTFWLPPSPHRLIYVALMFEVYLLGKSYRWGGHAGGTATLSDIANEARTGTEGAA